MFEGYHGDLRDLSVTAASAVVDTVDPDRAPRRRRDRLRGRGRGAGPDRKRPTGEFHLDGDDFTLSGGVKGSTGEGERFTTDEVRYVAKRRVLHQRRPGGDCALERRSCAADGMELELAHQKLRLLGSVRARVKPE